MSNDERLPSCLDARYILKEELKAPPYHTSAITYIARILGVPLHKLPADVDLIEKLCSEIEPRSRGIDPVVWSNKKATCKAALILSGVAVSKSVRVTKNTYLLKHWSEVDACLVTKREQAGMSSFIRFCNLRELLPSRVDGAVLEAFQTKMFVSKRGDTAKTTRTAAIIWNELAVKHPHLEMQNLPVPERRTNARLTRFDQFSPPLLAEWNNLEKWATAGSVTCLDVRSDPIGLRTLELWGQYLRGLVTALVATGTYVVEEVTSLSQIVDIDNFDRALSYQIDDVSGGKPTHNSFYMALVFYGIARDYLKVSDDHLARMQRVLRAIKRPDFDMTEKNKRLVMKFDNPATRNRFLTAPDRIFSDMYKKTQLNGRRLVFAQAAIAIEIETHFPLRIENLIALEFDRHVFLRPGGTSTLYVAASEVKGGKTLEFDIPKHLSDRLVEYRDVIFPSVTGESPRYVFSNSDGTQKHLMSVRYLLQAYFKKYVGFHMNPHAYRHLAAKFILDESPGAHAVVKDLLGHKRLSTTINYYTGTDTKRAGRYHSGKLEAKAAEAREAANFGGLL